MGSHNPELVFLRGCCAMVADSYAPVVASGKHADPTCQIPEDGLDDFEFARFMEDSGLLKRSRSLPAIFAAEESSTFAKKRGELLADYQRIKAQMRRKASKNVRRALKHELKKQKKMKKKMVKNEGASDAGSTHTPSTSASTRSGSMCSENSTDWNQVDSTNAVSHVEIVRSIKKLVP